MNPKAPPDQQSSPLSEMVIYNLMGASMLNVRIEPLKMCVPKFFERTFFLGRRKKVRSKNFERTLRGERSKKATL